MKATKTFIQQQPKREEVMSERNDKVVEIDSIVNIFAKKNKGMRKKSQFEGDDMVDKPVMPEEESLADEYTGGKEEEKEGSPEKEKKEEKEGEEKGKEENPTEEISESLVENLSNIAEDNDLTGTDVVDIVKDIVEDEKGESELVEEVEKEISARKASKRKGGKRKSQSTSDQDVKNVLKDKLSGVVSDGEIDSITQQVIDAISGIGNVGGEEPVSGIDNSNEEVF